MAASPPAKRSRKEDTGAASGSASPPEKMSPVVVFAHGAGAPSSSAWMVRWKEMLGKALHAVEVVTFDYPYFSGAKKRPPPKAEKLVEYHADVVRKVVAKYPSHPLILAGKSMGSRVTYVAHLLDGCPFAFHNIFDSAAPRVSCMVAGEEDIDAAAIICLGYPLKGINGAVRDELLLQLTVPTIFVQGSKDALCPLDKLKAVREKMKSLTELHVVASGDHSFKIGRKHLQTTDSTQEDTEDLAVQTIASFISEAIKA